MSGSNQSRQLDALPRSQEVSRSRAAGARDDVGGGAVGDLVRRAVGDLGGGAVCDLGRMARPATCPRFAPLGRHRSASTDPSPFPNRPALTRLVACGECKQPFASVRCVAAFTGGVAVSCGGGEAANRVSWMRCRAQRAVRDLGRRAHVMTSAEVRSAISSDVRSAMSSDVRSAISAEVRSAMSGGWLGQRRARDLPRLGGIAPPQPTPAPSPIDPH